MGSVLIVTVICLAFQAERAVLDTYSFFGILRSGLNTTKKKKKHKSKIPLFILIPALQEQDIIAETIQNVHNAFKGEAHIVIITTERESAQAEVNSKNHLQTKDVVLQTLKKTPDSSLRRAVRVIHYPKTNGRMAHQINFALKKLHRSYPNAYFILYNADSIPSPSSENAFKRIFYIHPKAVVQQPCAFIRDTGSQTSAFVNALSLFQTLFCIGHETGLIKRYVPRLRKHSDISIKEFLFSPLGWIVGHGSAMSIRTCLKYGGFPEKYMNEDLTFGYILSSYQIPIYSIPILEIADVPMNWSSLVRQKTVWFWNFLEYIRCYKDLDFPNIPTARRLALLVIGLGRGAYWFLSAFFFGLPIILGIIFQDWFILIIGTLGFACFSGLPILCLALLLPKTLEVQGFPEYAKRVRSIPLLKMLLALPIVVLSDSIGPWIATTQWINWKLTGILPNKPKTN
jgi:hypothetical protein